MFYKPQMLFVTFLCVATYCFFVFIFIFYVLTAQLMILLGLGTTKNAWLGLGKWPVLASNNWFCSHKHGWDVLTSCQKNIFSFYHRKHSWSLSRGLLKNTQWCHASLCWNTVRLWLHITHMFRRVLWKYLFKKSKETCWKAVDRFDCR